MGQASTSAPTPKRSGAISTKHRLIRGALLSFTMLTLVIAVFAPAFADDGSTDVPAAESVGDFSLTVSANPTRSNSRRQPHL